ncbi:hypothetical protein GCM10023321_26230 [Pseudonocardia eucalypti]|uniref:Uncharacterized protein n=1 Tax=Pseudonocardia eucalypti TaxID=648755 RepID=A0ABP9PZV5_9PSEU
MPASYIDLSALADVAGIASGIDLFGGLTVGNDVVPCGRIRMVHREREASSELITIPVEPGIATEPASEGNNDVFL